MMSLTDCFLLFHIDSKKKCILNILGVTIKLVLKNLYVLQQIISFVGAAKGS